MNHSVLRRLFCLLLVSVMTVGSAAAAAPAFLDVDSDDWYAEAVSYVVDQSLFAGRSESLFAPELAMNRAMFYTVLQRMSGQEVTNEIGTNLSDVPAGKWYTGAVVWAISTGLADCRTDSAFGAADTVPRWELCLALKRYDTLSNANALSVNQHASFLDLGQLDEETCDAIAACQAAGIVQGRSDGRFDPLTGANRAQVAQIISSYHQLLSEEAPAPKAASVAWDDVAGWTGKAYLDFPLSAVGKVTAAHILWLNGRILAENVPASMAALGETLDGNKRHLTNYGTLGTHDCVNLTACLDNGKSNVPAGTALNGAQEYYGYSLQVSGVLKQDPWHQLANDTGKDPWQCTWWAWGRAAQYLQLKYGQDLAELCNGRTNLGNGGDYYYYLQSYFRSDQTPSANSIVSWRGGTYGHVAYVEAVDENGIWVSMANNGSSWRGITYIVKADSAANPYPLHWHANERFNGFNHLDYLSDGTPLFRLPAPEALVEAVPK